MKKICTAAIFIFSLSVSCTKDVGEQADQIVYTDVNPDIRLKTIREFEPDPHYACPHFLIPRDSSVSYELDLDKDSEVDYKINVCHTTYTYTYGSGYGKCSSHCDVFSKKYISISPVSSNAFICSNLNDIENLVQSPRNFYEDEGITKDEIWTKKESFAKTDVCGISGPLQIGSFITPYWGLYFNGQLAWIKIRRTEIKGGIVVSDSNGVEILEWAYNKTRGKSIKAGQKN